MLKKNNLVETLKNDFPEINFIVDDVFMWSFNKNTIFYNQNEDDWQLLLIHELAHCILGHMGYKFDRELLKMEVEAWELVKDKLAPKYDVIINYDLIDETIYTYKDWLHKRSVCPKCKQIGSQKQHNQYFCINCNTHWKTNEAKFTSLKRYKIK